VRVAALDLGTNTTRLLVADVEDGRLAEVHRETRITRLGEGVDARGRLLPLPIARVRNVLTDYRRTLEGLGAERTLAVATSAVRDAENGEAFLGEVEWSYGFITQLLSGDEEAELTRRGVDPKPGTLVVDIGGGSTELIVGTGADPAFHVSTQVGVVRHTERHLHGDPPTSEELAALRREAAAAFATAVPDDVRATEAIAIAGTATQCAAIALGEYDRERVQGHVLARAELEEMLAMLAALPLERRRRVPGLDPDRAPTIVAGAAILLEALGALGLERVEVSENDILRGVALGYTAFL
jgi:exopolyphosphatase / guanosine-5'-triphosphate,3'-diphosphate pyrophosphatase